MTRIVLRPGQVSLAEWRAAWRGDEVVLAESAASAVAAGAKAVKQILEAGAPVYGINTGVGKLASLRIAEADLARLQRNLVLSHAAGVGEAMPAPLVRLMMVLKLASLAQGASGVRTQVVGLIADMIGAGLVPVIPCQGSVGASGDIAPLAHLAETMIGEGEIALGGAVVPAREALARAGLEPIVLEPKEGLALFNGTQFSTAYALAGLFEAERVFRCALVTGALATDAARGSDTPFDHRIHVLRRHAGQIETACALRSLMAGSAIRDSHRQGDARVQDPYSLRCQPQVMGAVLSLLRQAAATLADEANGVTDNPLIVAGEGPHDPPVALSGGNFHAEPVAFAADMIAMALCEIGSICERRIAMLIDPAVSGLPAFLTPEPGLDSGFMLSQVTAAALVAENRQRAHPASIDSIPTCANQEDHVSMAAHGARRLMAMGRNAGAIVAIELMTAAQGCDFHRPLASSPPLEAVRSLLRTRVAHRVHDRRFAPDLEAAIGLVARGAVLEAAAAVPLPGVEAPA